MTTLATDGTTLAADGQISSGDIILSLQAQKIHRLSDGTIVAYAGCIHSGIKFVDWLKAGSPPENAPTLAEGFCALRINGTSTVLSYDYTCHAIEMPVPLTVGSGRELALGAMLAGASPKEAVKAACQRDVWSGGRIHALTVKS